MNSILNIIRWMVYDVETQKSSDEVGGWDNAHMMLVSAIVVYDSLTDKFYRFTEQTVLDAIELMKKADVVVAYNQLKFDNQVLGHYTTENLNEAFNNLDLAVIQYSITGHKNSMNAFATASLGAEKSASGLQALEWYKEGKMEEIFQYCEDDVRITKELFETAVKYDVLHYSYDNWSTAKEIKHLRQAFTKETGIDFTIEEESSLF